MPANTVYNTGRGGKKNTRCVWCLSSVSAGHGPYRQINHVPSVVGAANQADMARGNWLWQETNGGWASSIATALGSGSQRQKWMKPMNRSKVDVWSSLQLIRYLRMFIMVWPRIQSTTHVAVVGKTNDGPSVSHPFRPVVGHGE